MAVTRYRNTEILSGSHYGTFDLSSAQLTDVSVFLIRTSAMDRLDTLAFKYLGAGEYWWVLALLNDIEWAFSFTPGEILKIPYDVQDVLRHI